MNSSTFCWSKQVRGLAYNPRWGGESGGKKDKLLALEGKNGNRLFQRGEDLENSDSLEATIEV